LLNTEDHFNKYYNLRRFGQKQFEGLKKSVDAPYNKRIEGVSTYRILDNPIYKKLLYYIEPPKVKDGIGKEEL